MTAPFATCSAQTVVVPNGKMVMLDGRISTGEWSDAAHIALADGGQFLVKQSGDYVLLAVSLSEGKNFFLDLYLSPNPGEIFDLHASAKLGERQLQKGTWSEWKWWNNKGWTANVTRVESFDDKRFLSENVREYQIRRSRFPSRVWRARLGISVGSSAGYQETDWPADSRDADTRRWIELKLK